MKKGILTFLITVVSLAFNGRPASATVILDSDFFSGTTHMLITFETDGMGNLIDLGRGDYLSMPSDEYAHYGFTFEPDISWVNDAGSEFDEAQAIGGSPEIGIPGADDDFIINFSVPVRAFGFWVINNPNPDSAPHLTLQAYGDNGLIEEAIFEGDAIDGAIGNSAEYGFLGIASKKFITSIHVTKGATMLDNFTFSPIPEPATFLILGLGCLALLRKRPA